MSFGDLAELVSERLKKRFTDIIRPHVSSPRQKDGQVHVLPLFPNALAAPPSAPASAAGVVAAGSAGQGNASTNGGDGGVVKVAEPVRLRVGVSGLGLGFLGYRGLRDDIRGLHRDIAGLHCDMGGLRERMAKLEGAMDGFTRGMQQAGGTRSAVTES